MKSPRLKLTVPRALWDAMADATRVEFADSYLSGAVVQGGKLLPMTQTGWGRLLESKEAMRVLKEHGLTLVKPPRFGS